MAAPTVFRWSDTGAPTLDNTAGSLISVLDFCLPSRGWVKEFTGTGKAVYRAGTGNRKYYRILDDNSMINSSFYSALVTGYDSMTGIDTGAGWGQSAYIRKSYNDTGVKRWICVVDEKGFWIITQPHGGTSVDIGLRQFAPHYIGETIPALPGQTSRDIIAACTSLGPYNSVVAAPENDSTYARAMCNRSLDSSASSLSLYIERLPLYTGGNASYLPAGNFTNALYSYPYNGELLYCKGFLKDNAANTIGDYVPWLYYTAQKGSGFTNGGTVSADGMTFLTVYVGGVASYGLLSTVVSTTTTPHYNGCILIATNTER